MSSTQTETKHTPGPWAVRDHEDTDDDFTICGPEEEVITFIDGTDLLGNVLPRAAHDARLIAAAPLMLDALRKVEQTLGQMTNGGMYDEFIAVRAAIAAATEEAL